MNVQPGGRLDPALSVTPVRIARHHLAGGTGLTEGDVTLEALKPLFDKRIDGFSAVLHLVSYQSFGLSTLQSRDTAGLMIAKHGGRSSYSA